jgi:hypothetical protein
MKGWVSGRGPEPGISQRWISPLQRTQRQRITQTQNYQPGGDAATVAGDVGPGLDNWPSGHTTQDTDSNALIRIRSPRQKSFGEAFGAAMGLANPATAAAYLLRSGT